MGNGRRAGNGAALFYSGRSYFPVWGNRVARRACDAGRCGAAVLLAALFVALVLGADARADEAAARAMKGDAALGEYIAGECLTCHQASGAFQGIPTITGWPTDAFIQVLYEYRDGHRENPTMRLAASGLSDEEMAALAAYFETLAKP